MLTHINGIYLHISAKSCTFAVENKRILTLTLTPKPRNYGKERDKNKRENNL